VYVKVDELRNARGAYNKKGAAKTRALAEEGKNPQRISPRGAWTNTSRLAVEAFDQRLWSTLY
jgi:hypothetical protein